MKTKRSIGSVLAVMQRRARSLLLIAGLLIGAAGTDDARGNEPEPFPDEWFYDGADRPQALRDLEGKDAPEITTAEWIGDEVSLESLRGQVVVLDFWATWCGPCMAAIPKNVELVDKYEDEGLAFIGVHDANSGWDRASSVVADKGINYPVALDNKKPADQSGETTQAYNLKFWPTYVVIDREGVVRGAGLMPQHVADAVRVLLDEPWDKPVNPDGTGQGTSDFPDEWYYGGAGRPLAYRQIENRRAPGVTALAWHPTAPDPGAWKHRVVVLQFVRPEFAYTVAQLDRLSGLIEQFSPQGVVFVAVCDARSDWQNMIEQVHQRELKITVLHDAPPDENPDTRNTNESFGVRFAPATIVIDRANIVRAAGIRIEHLEGVINALMAERIEVQEPATLEQLKRGGKP